ncbi:alpha/beta fold hydrolase [Parapedobacter soli]|uniref:alpha/beta fold hydrolase n=1 Tax=Parapedobacter soli TaxID=416955 RepID=UPI0021CA0DCA|nr:alpha/beta hydrolase [Parapedobacter soli]
MTTLHQFALCAVIAPITLFSSGVHPKNRPALNGVKNVVLVHGAFADGTSWAAVISRLQEKGYHVAAVQNPLTSLEDDVAATKRAIALMDGPVLLVGHSWAGMVISAAGNDAKVAGLVYVAALIPDEGQSVVDVNAPFPPGPGGAEFRPDAEGFLSMTAKGIHEDFAQDLPEAQRNVLVATQTPWAAAATVQPVHNVAWKTKPSWCIVATEDRMINPDLERATAKMINATTIELESSHVPMVSQPDAVANFIDQAANRLSAN